MSYLNWAAIAKSSYDEQIGVHDYYYTKLVQDKKLSKLYGTNSSHSIQAWPEPYSYGVTDGQLVSQMKAARQGAIVQSGEGLSVYRDVKLGELWYHLHRDPITGEESLFENLTGFKPENFVGASDPYKLVVT